jgi:predicted RND superfamily exporter protein
MGVDYSIHLVKRFQLESCSKPVDQALKDTFVSTGSSVLMSGLTTALALSVLIASDFRGFSEFGIICSTAILMVLISMFTVLPVSIVIGHRIGFIKPKALDHHKYLNPRRTITILLALASLAAIFVSIRHLHFNYYLANLQYNKNKLLDSYEVKKRERLVYSGSMTPGAIYLADNLRALDEMLEVLRRRKEAFRETTKLGRIRSLRDFSPSPKVRQERFDLIQQIKEQVQGSWTRRVEGEDKIKLIEDLKNWTIKKETPAIEEIPEVIRKSLQSKDGSRKFLITIHPTVQRRDGRNAMSFTEELYGLNIPAGVIGPVGETAVFAEILWVVTGEGWWLTLFTILGVFLLIWINRKSLKDTLWILLPLMAAVVLSLGVMVAFGHSLNFFNLVVIPALFGMGVDGGVHYFRRWIEKEGNLISTQQEMFEPLSVATITTMLGYSGMIFANHHGIKSIGTFACIGLSVIWLASLFLLPGLLQWFSRRFSQAKNSDTRK